MFSKQKEQNYTRNATMVRGIASSWRHPTLSSTVPQLSTIATRRHISINHKSIPQDSPSSTQSPDETNALNKTITDSENIGGRVTQLKPYQTLETAKFETLGTPPTILSIHSPPSVPIYLRRGSLLSIYGLKSSNKNNSNTSAIGSVNIDDGPIIRNTIEYPHWWKQLILTGKFQSFQKLISTIPISLLISSHNKSSAKATTDSSFVNLILDGLNDWAILNKDAIQVYTGNSLSVSVHSIPRYISKKLAKQLGTATTSGAATSGIGGLGSVFGLGKGTARIETGLRSLWNRGYTLLSGRGQVGLVGNGGIYQLDVGEQEEILINKRAILAITVNGPFDLENCLIKDTSTVSSQQSLPPSSSSLLQLNAKSKKQVTNKTIAHPQSPPTSSTIAYHQLKHYWSRASQSTKSLIKYFYQTYHNLKTKWTTYTLGTSDFVKIIGPRNILIQSSYNIPKQRQQIQQKLQLHLFSNGHSDSVIPSTDSEKNPQDYLSYVTIDPKKGAVFSNTQNFKQTVDKIERKLD